MPTQKSFKTADFYLKLIEESANAGIWTLDLETSEVIWSRGLFKMLGFDPHTIIPSVALYHSLVHPDDRANFDRTSEMAFARGLENRSFRIIRPDGILRRLHGSIQSHLDRYGKPMMLVGLLRDVTTAEEMCIDFNAQAEVIKLLASLLRGKVWLANADGGSIKSPSWATLFGQVETDWQALDTVHPDDRIVNQLEWKGAIAGKRKYDAKIRVTGGKDIFTRIHSQAVPILDENGVIERWVGHSIALAASSGPLLSIDAAQIRAARAFLNWTCPELAKRSAVSFSTVRRMEQNSAGVRAQSVSKVQKTLEASGVSFLLHEDGHAMIHFNPPMAR